jgi:membrane-bound ClpP family serine protease
MSELGIVIILFIVGLIAILVEIFIPGGILGITGILLLAAGVVLSFRYFGVSGGIVALIVALFIGPIIWLFGLSFFPRTPLGKVLTLKTSQKPEEGYTPFDEQNKSLVGVEGVAASNLRPSGIAVINGERHQVITQGESIEKDAKIKVIKVEGNQIFVRQV